MSEIWRIWLSGGWVMAPLFALAVLLYTQAFQLVTVLRRTDLRPPDALRARRQGVSAEEVGGLVAEILRYTQSGVSSTRQVRDRFQEVRAALVDAIDRRLAFVSTLVAAAPLLGLLGTVLGMLQTFFGISTSGGGETAGVVASGISEALVTTQTGLMIALPGLFVVMLIRRRRHRLEARLAHLESLTLIQLRFE